MFSNHKAVLKNISNLNDLEEKIVRVIENDPKLADHLRVGAAQEFLREITYKMLFDLHAKGVQIASRYHNSPHYGRSWIEVTDDLPQIWHEHCS